MQHADVRARSWYVLAEGAQRPQHTQRAVRKQKVAAYQPDTTLHQTPSHRTGPATACLQAKPDGYPLAGNTATLYRTAQTLQETCVVRSRKVPLQQWKGTVLAKHLHYRPRSYHSKPAAERWSCHSSTPKLAVVDWKGMDCLEGQSLCGQWPCYMLWNMRWLGCTSVTNHTIAPQAAIWLERSRSRTRSCSDIILLALWSPGANVPKDTIIDDHLFEAQFGPPDSRTLRLEPGCM